jgi:hypothetical protein
MRTKEEIMNQVWETEPDWDNINDPQEIMEQISLANSQTLLVTIIEVLIDIRDLLNKKGYIK